MKSLFFRNGHLINQNEATIALSGSGFQGSKAVYTSLRTYNDVPFMLHEHMQRLQESAVMLGFELPFKKEDISNWVKESIQQAGFKECFLRITAIPHDVFIACRELIIDTIVYEGVSVLSVPVVRELYKAKVVGTPGTIRAHQQAQEAGCYEALLYNPYSGNLSEGSRSNLLWIKNNTLYWSDDALSGITQKVVTELAQDLGFAVQKGQLAQKELDSVQEVFITQTSRGIIPVTQIDEQSIGDGKPGAITLQLMHSFQEFTQQYHEGSQL